VSGWDLTGVFGAIVLLFPDLYRKFATAFLYERPESIEWNEGFSSGVRAIGALYVFGPVEILKSW